MSEDSVSAAPADKGKQPAHPPDTDTARGNPYDDARAAGRSMATMLRARVPSKHPHPDADLDTGAPVAGPSNTKRARQTQAGDAVATAAKNTYGTMRASDTAFAAVAALPEGQKTAVNLYLLLEGLSKDKAGADLTFKEFAALPLAAREEIVEEWHNPTHPRTWQAYRGKESPLRITMFNLRDGLNAILADSGTDLEKLLTSYRAFSDEINKIGDKRRLGRYACMLRTLCFPETPFKKQLDSLVDILKERETADAALMQLAKSKRKKKIAIPTIVPDIGVVQDMAPYMDEMLMKLNIDPHDLLGEQSDFPAKLEILNKIRNDDMCSSRHKGVLNQWRLHYHPLPLDELFLNEILAIGNTSLRKSLATARTLLAEYPLAYGLTDTGFLKNLQDEEFRKTVLASLGSGYSAWAGSAVATIAASEAAQDFIRRMDSQVKTEDAGGSNSVSTSHLVRHDAQENPLGDMMTEYIPRTAIPVFNEDGDEVGIHAVILHPDQAIINTHAQKYHPDHDRRFPFGDPCNLAHVAPHYASAADRRFCDGALAIGHVAIHAFDNLYSAYKQSLTLPEISALGLRQKNRQDFKAALEDSVRSYLEATIENRRPACHECFEVVRLEPGHCDSAAEALVLANPDKPQYGVIRKADAQAGDLPGIWNASICTLFSGVEPRTAEEHDAYREQIRQFYDEATAANYTISLKSAAGDAAHHREVLCTLGYANMAQYINSTTVETPSGRIRADETACNAAFLNGTVLLQKEDGSQYKQKFVAVILNKPVNPEKQVKLYYGSDYDFASTANVEPASLPAQPAQPASPTLPVKREPEDTAL